jgi:hypothetical protein
VSDYTVTQLEYTPLFKAIDALLRGLDRLGLPHTQLDPDGILREARRVTGLTDWGRDDFQEPLRRLLETARARQLTGIARFSTHQICSKAVQNRLWIEDYIRRHPEVEDIPIERPVFILGFPRTGTTLLQNLMSQTETLRPLRFWELSAPVPAHEDKARDLRIRRRRAETIVKAAYFIAPEQKHIHQLGVDTAEECWPLFFNAFQVMNYDLTAEFRDFGDWMMGRDMVPAYRYYKRQLQILAHHTPTRHFVLKCPEHLWFVGALLEVFPDACVVWTHRDPVASVASYCSLSSLQRRMLYGYIDREGIGRHIRDRFRIGVERAMAARARHGDESSFFDVDFMELVQDPMAMVHRIQGHFGLPRSEQADAAMRAWLDNGRKDKRGQHRYSADQWGLDAAAIHAEYAPYIERFSIPVKAPGA